mmetsp:Transcript_23835/g.46328  ORF Transcript_23835/g.46328 Transcript_23835/m.46328 type:complete len:208 (-) Transcript_23835:1378-2001(-)
MEAPMEGRSLLLLYWWIVPVWLTLGNKRTLAFAPRSYVHDTAAYPLAKYSTRVLQPPLSFKRHGYACGLILPSSMAQIPIWRWWPRRGTLNGMLSMGMEWKVMKVKLSSTMTSRTTKQRKWPTAIAGHAPVGTARALHQQGAAPLRRLPSVRTASSQTALLQRAVNTVGQALPRSEIAMVAMRAGHSSVRTALHILMMMPVKAATTV